MVVLKKETVDDKNESSTDDVLTADLAPHVRISEPKIMVEESVESTPNTTLDSSTNNSSGGEKISINDISATEVCCKIQLGHIFSS